MSVYTMPLTQQQEQFSIAYVHSIASAAGYGVEGIRVDVDSVDLMITQYGQDDIFPEIDVLQVQLKCTYAHKPKADGIHFPLKLKNYDDLRRNCHNPRILVVVYVPNTVDDWLSHSDDSLALRHSAYWVSLRNSPAVTTDTPTVVAPNKFTVDALKQIMNLLVKGLRP